VVLLGLIIPLYSQCVVVVNGTYFDFTLYTAHQVTWENPDQTQTVLLTLCAWAPCGDAYATICSSAGQEEQYNLGQWATVWQGGGNSLTGRFDDGDRQWCPQPRRTEVTFKCVDGPLRFANFSELDACVYKAEIEIPRSICLASPPCCTPDTYNASRVENDGSLSVFQADGSRGMWFDQNYESSGSSVLCVKSYDRCFTFTPTQCTAEDFRPAPRTCYGNTTYRFLRQGFLGQRSIKQSAWYSKRDSTYVVTVPVPSASNSSCMAVSGNRVNTVIEIGTTPNETFWEIPKTCLKFIFRDGIPTAVL